MRIKLLLFIFSLFIVSLLPLLSFFPVINTAYAMNSQCPSFGTFGGLPGLSFTVTPASVDKNHDFVAQLTASQSVINQYIQKERYVNFYIKGYMGGITDDPITNDNRLLRTTNGKFGGIFVPQNGDSGKVTNFRAQANTNPGTIRFYLFAVNSDISIRDCIINTNTPSVNFTEADPGDEPAPECVGENVECDPTGVGASNLCVCSNDYDCKPNASGENRCVSKTTSTEPNEPLSAPCNVNNPDTWTDKEGCKRIRTALGTIPTDTNTVVRWILGFVLSISGGILLLLLIINGYKLMVSQGDPEKIQDARGGIISGVAGLLLIIFSLVLLQLITVNILGIPGFR